MIKFVGKFYTQGAVPVRKLLFLALLLFTQAIYAEGTVGTGEAETLDSGTSGVLGMIHFLIDLLPW